MDFTILLPILALLAFAGASTEPNECREVVCPQLAHIECPDDSYPSLLEPPHNIAPPAATFEAAGRVLQKRSLVQYHKRESIKIVPGHIRKRSVPETDDPPAAVELNSTHTDALFHLCCPQRVCLCRSQCPEPICIGDLVPLVKDEGSQRPGDCCATYKCARPPNCALLEPGYEWREHCKRCRCEGGVSVCHEEEVCRISATATSAGRSFRCYSSRLGRHYSVGDRWMDDECTHCECLPDGEPRCQVSVCRTLMCSKQVKSTGECCPHCDISNTHFCEGHEFCSMVCKNGYQRDNVSECNLCRCAQETPQSASASPSATTASPDQESPTNQMVTFIIGICVVALGLTACVVWWFCWRPEKKSYETVSTVDSRQSSEVAKSNGISGMPYCDIVSLKMNVDGDTLKKTLREQNGTLTNQHNYT